MAGAGHSPLSVEPLIFAATSDQGRMKSGYQYGRGVADSNSILNRNAIHGTPYVYAPVWRRFVAGLIDWMLALIWGAVGGVFAAIAFIIIAGILHSPGDVANFAPLTAMFLYFPAAFVVASLILLLFAYRSSRRGVTNRCYRGVSGASEIVCMIDRR